MDCRREEYHVHGVAKTLPPEPRHDASAAVSGLKDRGGSFEVVWERKGSEGRAEPLRDAIVVSASKD